MPIDGPFPEHVDFFNEVGVLIRQPVSYEWIPTKCSHCTMLGHSEDVCRKKVTVRMEWRKKSQSTSQPSAPDKEQNCPPLHKTSGTQVPPRIEEESSQELPPCPFTLISKGAPPNVYLPTPMEPPRAHHNSFMALNEAHLLDELQNVLQRERQPNSLPHVSHS